jgi:ABC-2 type transport system ATP-binding protein
LADNLTKWYGDIAALRGLSMTVPRGEIFGFLGPNGAGKTTAIKLFLGLAHATSGQAKILGAPPSDLEMRRRIGYLPELFRFQDWLSAREVLELHCTLAGVARARRRSAIDDVLELVGLHERGEDRVASYSKGMQQRLGLGVALVAEPEIAFLDEPTSALDPLGRRDVRDVLRAVKARGATVFLNSHLLSEVEQVCDRVAIVDRGRVVGGGDLADLLGRSTKVRIRLAEALPDAAAIAARFGRVEQDDAMTLRVDSTTDANIPDLVRDLVAAGARILSVAREAPTLEERFLHLLVEPDDAAADHR